MHTVHHAFFGLPHDGFHRPREALVLVLHIGQHFHTALHFTQRGLRCSQVVLRLLGLSAAGLRLSGGRLRLLCRFGKRLLARGQFPFEIVLCLFFGIQLLCRCRDFGIQRHFAVAHARQTALGGCSVEFKRVQRALLFALCLLCLPKCLLSLYALLLLFGGLFSECIQFRRLCLLLLMQRRNTLAPFGKLRIHALHLLGAVCALLPRALDILLAVADVRLNNRLTADLLGSKLLGFAQLVPQTFGLPVNLTQRLSQLLGLRIQRFLLLFCIRKLLFAGCLVFIQLGSVILELLKRQQPQRDLKHAQLIPQMQKPFRLVSLLLERLKPVFQFAVQVADAHQIFLGG